MNTQETYRPSNLARLRTRWAAIGATIAVTLGAGGIGFVSAASSGERLTFVSIDACRVADIRPAFQVGPKASPLGPNETMTVSAHGSNGDCTGIPNTAVALSLNVTALNATERTFLTIFAAGTPRPNASSLNPSPGQPPAPNAVTTRLSPGGEFSVFNRAGTVDVFIDVNGYYVDHNHDDRYDTKAEVDAKIAAQAALGPEEIEIGPFDMAPVNEGTNWRLSVGYSHTASGSSQCLIAPIDPVDGQSFSALRLSYINGSAADVDVEIRLAGTRTTPGPFVGSPAALLHDVARESFTVPPTGSLVIAEVSATTSVDPVIRGDFRYAVLICTPDPLLVIGARVTLAD